MNVSILNSIKKLLGIDAAYTNFDTDIIIHINTVFFTLYQLGVGPKNFTISDAATTWASYLPNDNSLEAVKTYMYAKVKLAFDPPQQGSLMEALRELAAEYESRLGYAVDPMEE